jgi:Carboxypeptidase regulatory-like domain
MRFAHPRAGRRALPLSLSLATVLVMLLALAACGVSGPGGSSAGQGTLVGDVSAGPTCPVQSTDHPCPPKPVPNARVTIETPSGSTVVATATTDAQGHFSVSLPPGDYRVSVEPGTGGLPRQDQPTNVTIHAGQTTSVKIQMDTGIR